MNKKIINNAISAYFGLGVIFLLLSPKNQNINNDFVNSHSKIAITIHFGFLLVYLLFIKYSFLSNINFNDFYLNHIIASILFLILFGFLLYSSYKASLGEVFKKGEIKNLTKTNSLVEFKKSNLNEEGILTTILSLIPFIGFIIRGKFYNYKSSIINNNIKLNFLITIFLSILFVFGHLQLMLLFGLFYIIYIVFFSIIIIIEKNIISINIPYVSTMEDIYIYSIGLKNYLKSYFSNNFLRFNDNLNKTKEHYKNIIQEKNEYINTLGDPKINIYFTYIPFINLICLFDYNSKNKYHIFNGLILTILTILILIFGYYDYFIFILIIDFFNIGYKKIYYYKMYFLSDLFYIFIYLFKKIFFLGKIFKDKQKEVKEEVFKI